MGLDLNLLVALDALLEESSVTAAAHRLHLSPPAMSRTLGRIRHAMGDPILVRSGRIMTATPRALALREQVHVLVTEAQAVLAPERELELHSLRRTFSIQCHDAVATAIGAPLVASMLEQAPGVRLRILAEGSSDTDDLRYGQVDLEIGSHRPGPELSSDQIAEGQFSVVVRPGHPRVRGSLTLEQYAAEQHVTVSRRGRLADPVDEAMAAHDVRRTVVASLPTSSAALHAVRGSDLLVTVPEGLCRPTVRKLELLVLPLPMDLPPIPMVLAWHKRYDQDLGHAWLRKHVRAAVLDVMLGDF